jgi:Ca2+-binding RTX toxin-like protein
MYPTFWQVWRPRQAKGKTQKRRARPAGQARSQLRLENLEERTLLSLFGSPTDYATGYHPRDVALWDINGDGIPDIAVSNVDSAVDSVSVLLGNGNGTFRPKTDYAVGLYPDAIALGDLNGDHRLDIVTGNANGGSVSVLLNQGNGTFTRTDYSGVYGYGMNGVALGDLDGDGDLDLVTPTYALLNGGDGTFTVQLPFSVPDALPKDVSLGDLNGDGMLDLAVTYEYSAVVSVLPGHGDGTFGAGTDYALGGDPHEASSDVPLGDLNHDGYLDIVAPNSQTGTVSVLLNQGDGTFGPRTDLAAGTNPVGVALGDLNGDSHVDLFVAGGSDNSLSVFLGNGDGTFGPRTDIPLGTYTVQVALGDLNGDGRLDAVACDTDADKVSVLLNSPMTASFDPDTGILTIIGSSGDDTIKVGATTSGNIRINGGRVPITGGTPTLGNTTELRIFGEGGNDTISIINSALPGAEISGGDGNDSITGGSGDDTILAGNGNDVLKGGGGNDLLVGDAGNDMLFGGYGDDFLLGGAGDDILVGGGGNDTLDGGPGRNLMIGGAGLDHLSGGADDDLLIAGNTSYNNDTTALAAILSEWQRTDADYATRIAHLRGTMPGGNNGSYVLTSTTVTNDTSRDVLTGGDGLDWFWANLREIHDLQPGEQVN